jgi:hypothetical protein
MNKSFAIMALVMGASAVDLKFAAGMGEDEWNGETITMKGPTKLEQYTHLMTGESRMGHKEQ